ncbi:MULTISPECIES: hypothetical protein [unclassified Pseudoalteromonas]|uniref:hypothetical protein n=1 Tax=unclassified Pseudoalteromonas TaxID=194690 RepID=UPI0013FDA8BF|nr:MULTISPECIES: hypothetical protein [unclassified Pseudoalteromonas]MBH0042883.1 hypothetical protein [Pseudoalteromonas sp. SWXJZ10B]
METIEEKVTRFRTYNRTMIAAAFSKPNRRHQGIPAKLLLCSVFDSLSIAAFPNENKVGHRYRKTISEHSGWEHNNRVSLLQLCSVLESHPQLPSSFLTLNSWAKSEKKKRFSNSNSLLSINKGLELDPTFEELLDKWPKQKNKHPETLDRLSPERFTHKNLLYMYRNKLAHEFRLLGNGAESPFRVEFKPYYQEVSTVTDLSSMGGLVSTKTWRLVYPIGFFVKIAKNSLESICIEYNSKGTSPFLNYKESDLWLEQ